MSVSYVFQKFLYNKQIIFRLFFRQEELEIEFLFFIRVKRNSIEYYSRNTSIFIVNTITVIAQTGT